ncbi:MAG: type IVB secretion system coupling complex protein DotM/IcmP [Proteobacteria bacterium]|nr:type IVB secretion system coupling complex protein DotM/IcmP [Pseudomonadota bacterium]
MSGQGGGGGAQGEDKDTYALLWGLAGIAIISIVVWYFWGDHLRMWFIAIKKYETLAILFFIDDDQLRTIITGLSMAAQEPSNLTLDIAGKYSDYIGSYLKYPVIFLLLVMGIIMFKGHATMRFTKAYNMDTLAHQEKENYPQIAPVADLKLIEEDISKGPWAMAQNPMQFARAEKLLKVELVPDHRAAWKSEGVAKATVIREMASQTFANQLGPLWTGVNNLPPHTKALFACFLARAEHDTDACRKYLGKLAKTAAKGQVDYSDTEEYLKKYGKCKAAQKCQEKHAYILTVMASMLVLARVDGVLASADFLWVKPVDRRLWYVLNCVGRQVCVPEVSGVFAHWLAEKEMGRALTVPMVDEAVNALEKAIAMAVYIPEEGEQLPMASQ